MRNIAVKIEYNGANYAGWQVQTNGMAIQTVIEEAISIIVRHKVTLTASGRTDSGVHALGQVANFVSDTLLDEKRLLNGINAKLPNDIRISNVVFVPMDFHSRFSVIAKTYVYRVENRRYKSPFEQGRAYNVKEDLLIDKMRENALLFIGEHDFAAFRKEGSSAKSTIRTIHSINIEEKDNIIQIEVTGNGFLYNMVRIIAGTLVDIGRGKDIDIKGQLLSGKRTKVGATAPSYGLFLKDVKYCIDI